MDNKKIIEQINKWSNIYFSNSTLYLKSQGQNIFKSTGNNTSKAINNYNGERIEINVLKWFSDFWIYFEFEFKQTFTKISISIFQGSETDREKHQLFRAEWDDYNDNQNIHPQPHWHITSNQRIMKKVEEIVEMDENRGFLELINEENSKIVDISKLHFAMSANWINNETHIHSLNSEEKVIKWFQGLISHLKNELEYLKT